MSWETTLFYWSGWFALTSILAIIGAVSTAALWSIFKGLESAMRANASLFAAYLKYAYKYRFPNSDPEDISSFRIDGYQITVEEVEE